MTRPGRDAGRYRAAHLHQPGGWYSPGYLEIDAAGMVVAVESARPASWSNFEVHELSGFLLPGMPNLHAHAHQRGLAGRAEGMPGATRSDFWSWRDRMYRFANALSPEDLEAVATIAYVEMLKSGFTTVGEFHYLHLDRDGRPYANSAELSERIVAAAERAGIGLTLLPALFTQGGIGMAPSDGQRRFVHHDVDAFLRLVETLRGQISRVPALRVGVAPHSLRSVAVAELADLLVGIDGIDPSAPIHIHVAEQVREVEECLTALHARPVEWLLDHVDLGPRWTLIHATHVTNEERRGIAHRGATVGLCPMTEANLGDGLFPLVEYQTEGGRWGIGTDSNGSISLADELRTLDYGQRLLHLRRDTAVSPGDPLTEHPGRVLFDRALAGGASALAQPVGAIAPGLRADLIELDPDAVALLGHTPESVLDGWFFSATTPVVRNVMVAGTWVVRDGHHSMEQEAFDAFARTVRSLD
ncbi:MAG: formimidoylglutamate deiminase [Thermomicrobiales bacterium]